MHHLPALTCAALLLSLSTSGCGGGSKKATPGPDAGPDSGPGPGTGTVTLTIDRTAVSVSIGAQDTITATIVRGGGFTGPVTIAGTGAPAGVTVTGETIPEAETTALVTVAAGATATAGTASLSITGAATGVTIAPKTLALTVTAAATNTGQIGMGLEGEKAYDQFGSAIALSDDGKRVVIGALLNDGTGADAGHARVFERSGNNWVQVGADIDGEAAGDRFGTSAAISADGTRVAVGSYLNDGGGNSSGNVRVFDFVGGAWTHVGLDIDGTAGDGAGQTIELSASGHRVVVGGPGVGSVSGDVRVYELMGADWTQLGATITMTNEFGDAVTMSADGNRIAIGQPGAASSSRPGTVHVYDWNGTAWTLAGAAIDGEGLGDNFGDAVSLSNDGNVLAIGGSNNIGLGADGGGVKGGHVRVYRFAAGAWTQVGADLDGDKGNNIGSAVSLSGDGTRLLAGAPNIVRYYTLTGDTWALSATPTFLASSRNGDAVAISADGHTAATGATYFRGVAGAASGLVTLYDLP